MCFVDLFLFGLLHLHKPEQTEKSAHEFMPAIGVKILVRARAGYDRDSVSFAYIHSAW